MNYKVKIALVITAVTVVTVGASVKFYADGVVRPYSSEEQIATMAESLACDLSCMQKTSISNKYKFLAHNDDKPIYVSFRDCSENVKTVATKSLDYVFGIVGQMNEKYRYEIVENKGGNFFSDETVIEYRAENLKEDAKTNGGSSFAGLATLGQYNNHYTISYDKASFEGELSAPKQYNELLRQLCYVFQFSNNVDSSVKCFFNKDFGENYATFTANDIKCLACVYAPEFTSTIQQENVLAKVEAVVQPAEEMDYEQFIQKLGNYKQLYYDKFNIMFVEKFFSDEGNSYVAYAYTIMVNDGKYLINVWNQNEKCIGRARGTVVNFNGVNILKNVKLRCGFGESLLTYTPFESDVAFYKSNRNLYLLHDINGEVINCEITIKPEDYKNDTYYWFAKTT